MDRNAHIQLYMIDLQKSIGRNVAEVYFKLLIDHAVYDRVHT